MVPSLSGKMVDTQAVRAEYAPDRLPLARVAATLELMMDTGQQVVGQHTDKDMRIDALFGGAQKSQ